MWVNNSELRAPVVPWRIPILKKPTGRVSDANALVVTVVEVVVVAVVLVVDDAEVVVVDVSEVMVVDVTLVVVSVVVDSVVVEVVVHPPAYDACVSSHRWPIH